MCVLMLFFCVVAPITVILCCVLEYLFWIRNILYSFGSASLDLLDKDVMLL